MSCFLRPCVARAVRLLAMLTLLVCLTACADSTRAPEGSSSLAAVEQALAGTPAYAIILADARQSGTFFSSYALQYAIERGGALSLTDWFAVDKDEYDKFAPLKGMTLLTYADGVRNATAAPPGFQHVGDPAYGSWQRDSSGNNFWQFYGQYRLLSDLMGLALGGALSQGDWDGARRTGKPPPPPPSTSRPSPQRDDFFNRRMKQEAAKDTKFSNKVDQRLGRSTVGTRSRGASPGK